jgi:hypothetical protein
MFECSHIFLLAIILRGHIQKFTDWPPGAITANDSWHYVQLYRYFVSQSSEFCCHNSLCSFSISNYCSLFRYRLSPETFGYTLVSSSLSGPEKRTILPPSLPSYWPTRDPTSYSTTCPLSFPCPTPSRSNLAITQRVATPRRRPKGENCIMRALRHHLVTTSLPKLFLQGNSTPQLLTNRVVETPAADAPTTIWLH